MKSVFSLRRMALAFFLLAGVGGCWGAPAQTVQDNTAVLGMSRAQLEPARPDAQPVRSPRRLASGAVGLLRAPDVLVEGAHFEQTLFFKNQQLEQIDMVWLHAGHPGSPGTDATEATATAFTALVQSLRTRLGPELVSAASTQHTVMETASWVSGDANVMVYRSGKTDNPTVRLVVKQRQLVEAGEL